MRWDERIGRRLKLRDLHTLEVIAQLGSMAKASRELGFSQPAISKAVADMEHVLGVQLLERSAVGVELTPSGAALVERTRAVFDEVRQGVKDIERISDPYSGEVRVGATEPLTVTLAEIINRLSSKYPKITYSVSISDTTTLMQELRDRNLDIVITRWAARRCLDRNSEGPDAGARAEWRCRSRPSVVASAKPAPNRLPYPFAPCGH